MKSQSVEQVPVDPARVVAVLLADGWHRVTAGTFTVGVLRYGNDLSQADTPAFGHRGEGDVLGFSFEEASSPNYYAPTTLAGLLDSVLAVRHLSLSGAARPRTAAAG